MERSRVMFFVNCFKYIAVPFMVQNYGVTTHGFNRCVTKWNKAMRRILRIDGCGLNSSSRYIFGSIYT